MSGRLGGERPRPSRIAMDSPDRPEMTGMAQPVNAAGAPARYLGRLFPALGVGVLIAGAGLVVWNAAAYHQWPWSGYPSRLHTCGRNYLASGQELSRGQILGEGYHSFSKRGGLPGPLYHGEVWGGSNPALGTSARARGCGTVTWVRVGYDRFGSYVLSGGP